ncbi:MAG TPA: hypothetical protein VFJ16_26105 [Longimicrobium sp.]|nr:hypothetical protein [Longimicrobium sp.]
MPVKPEEFYLASQNLNLMKPPLVSDEVCGRTMLNRMYYAAYLATREALRRHLGNPRFDVAHTALSATLANAADPDVRDLGTQLGVLRVAREEADYQPDREITKWRAALHLPDARHVVNNASRLAARFPQIRPR